jgi:hypothetical protein
VLTLCYSEESQFRIERYIASCKAMDMAGATRASLEETRSYAVEALTAILLENAEATGFVKYQDYLRRRRTK